MKTENYGKFLILKIENWTENILPIMKMVKSRLKDLIKMMNKTENGAIIMKIEN